MYICICNQISEKRVIEAIQTGSTDIEHLSKSLGVGTDCGKCRPTARKYLEKRTAPETVKRKARRKASS